MSEFTNDYTATVDHDRNNILQTLSQMDTAKLLIIGGVTLIGGCYLVYRVTDMGYDMTLSLNGLSISRAVDNAIANSVVA